MTADERRLLRLYRALSPGRQEGLLDYAEFLLARVQPEMPDVPSEPLAIPRPARESVVKAIKRLRETYPMLDRAKILHETSGLMMQHLVHGKSAPEVINELEALFLRHFEALQSAG
ncbi:MAG: hypothetical protein KKG92_10295 [Gammaproteobacteria bacterium]|nr:hypothetical protein [Gammaproteobacteria bacterium]